MEIFPKFVRNVTIGFFISVSFDLSEELNQKTPPITTTINMPITIFVMYLVLHALDELAK